MIDPVGDRHRFRALPAVLLAAALAAACGRSSSAPTPQNPTPNPPPPNPPPTAPGPVTVNGNERIGWDQPVADGNIRDYQFMAFVDGRRTTLPDVQCAGTAGPSGYSCSAQLPYMTDGRHTIRIASSRSIDSESPVSDRSEEIVVIKGQAAAGAVAFVELRPAQADRDATTVEVVASHLSPVTDLAALPDGRVAVAEQAGVVRILASRPNDAAAFSALNGVSVSGGGLTGIAPHPAFARNHLLYLLYAADTGRGVMYRLARGREVDGRLGEIAILGDLAPAEREGSGAIRFGPDGKLYVALSDLSAEGAGAASYLGKVLRLQDGGRTPDDSPAGSPIFSSGHQRVFGLTPAPAGGAWFEAGQTPGGRIHLMQRATANARPASPRVMLDLGTDARLGAIAVYSGRAFPEWQGDLLVARLDGEGITRVPLNGAAPAPVSIPYLAGTYGRIRSVVEAGDGSIYLGTANRDSESASPRSEDDRVLRLSPRRPGS